MTNLNFYSMMKLSKQEMAKMKKEDIIEAIHTYSFYYKSNIDDVKKAKDALIEQSKGELFAKKMLAAYIGERQKDDEYDESYINRLDLADLVGRTLLKASRY